MLFSLEAPIARRVACLTALVAFAVAAPASAQRYKAEAVDGRLSSKGAIARKYVKNGSGDAQEFRDYIEKYFFPAMTQPTNEGLGDLEKSSGDLFKNFLYPATGATQKYVNDQAMAFAVRVLKDPGYHPSVRYNALLILGKLDDKYATGNEPPAPSAKANDLLCLLANRALSNARVPNYELVGSLIGLERHAQYVRQLPSAQQKNTAKTIYSVLSADKLSGEFTPEVRDWVFVRAAAAAGNLGVIDTKGIFAKTLAKRIDDDSLSLDSRAAIAAELGALDAKPGQFDTKPVVKSVVDLAVAIAKEEADIARQYEDFQLQGGQRFIPGRGKLSRRVIEGKEREPVLLREGLLAVLTDLRSGARAAKSMSPEADQAPAAAVDDAVTDAIRVVSDKGSIDLNVTEAVKRMAAKIEALAEPEPLAATE